MKNILLAGFGSILLLGMGELIHIMTGLPLIISLSWATMGFFGVSLYFLCLALAIMYLPSLKNAKFNGWK